MFKTILIGYDGPKRGDEATALAEALRDPRTGSLLLMSACPDSPGRALSEAAESEDADLVVVGAGERSALGRPLPGTAAERLVDDPPCAVAVAPPNYSGGDIRCIGVAYDGTSVADAALRMAESLAHELRASLTIYTAAEGPQPRVEPGTQLLCVPAEEIAGRAYGVVDLLFVGALRGNVSGELVRRAGCPVVVTPRPDAARRRRRDTVDAAIA